MSDMEKAARMVDSLGLFSTNETIDECTTGSLPFMSVQYLMAMVTQRLASSDIEERRALLLAAQEHLASFLELLRSYGVFEETLPTSRSPGVTRQHKIDRLQRCQQLQKSVDERKGAVAKQLDDSLVRQFYLDQVQLHALQALSELEMLVNELALLSHAPGEPARPAPPPPKHVRRVTQPFTILKTRASAKAAVFRPGHNLPTMTIDEYLALEQQRGGLISGGGPQQQPAEDDDERDVDDEEKRRSVRAMDEYKDDHRKGSGNTFNRG